MEVSIAQKKNQKRRGKIKEYRFIYLLLILPVLYILIFRYYPILTQLLLSFKKYTLKGGLWNSKWVGLLNYQKFFQSPEFGKLMVNTLRISVLQIIVGFAPPVLLAIFLFDMTSGRFRKLAQSVLYIPHFFSWVVVYNLVNVIFSNAGYLNLIREAIGLKAVSYMIDVNYFLPILIGSSLWKGLGWGTILYLAALTGIDTELFEVAKIDGAGPLQRIRYITLPGILPVMVFTLTMSLGRLFSAANTEQILLFYGPANYSVSDVIGTWVYRQGLGKLEYSLGAAVEMFQSVVGLLLVLICNKAANRVAHVGIW
ncbi:MAG: ABC transporter permease subunit [Clostridiales bacterium]|nr:ABC transporter permease subunit [Clostridiales bacterium]